MTSLMEGVIVDHSLSEEASEPPGGLVILVQSVIIIISFLLVSLIEFGDADAQGQNVTNNTSALMEKGIARSLTPKSDIFQKAWGVR
jgi:hypothetical protein